MNAKDKKNKLRIIHWNACSLRNKRQQFTEFLNDHDIDIALISETWLKPCHRMNIPNYNTVRNDRMSGQGGGTAIFIHRKYYCVPIQSTCQNLETTGITIKDKNGTTLNIYSCYKPPNTPLDPKDIYNIFKTNTPTILAGDLNCKNPTCGSFSTNPNGKILQKVVECLNLDLSYPDEPTHDSPPDILDIAIHKNLSQTVHSKVLHEMTSDHLPVLLILQDYNITRSDTTIKIIDWALFKYQMENTQPPAHTAETPQEIIDSIASIEDQIIQNLQKSTKYKELDLDRKYPAHIKEKLRKTNRLRKKKKKTCDPNDKKAYISARRESQKLTREHDNTSWDTYIENLDVSDQTVWKAIRRLTAPKKEEIIVKTNNNLTLTAEEAAEALADSYEKQLSPNPPTSSYSNNYLNKRITAHLQTNNKTALEPTNIGEIKAIIDTFPKKKAPGIDGITNEALKLLPNHILESLTSTFNASLKLAYFPNNWKTSIICPILKQAVNAYKEFIPDHARLRTPLVNLLKKDVVWVWSDECQKAFTNLKESLTTHPTLYLYQEGLPCQVYCNTSTFGIAGILKQVYPDGKTYPVQHFSRSLRGHERNYSDLELQCLAIVESVDNFRACLMGRKFTILSDHPALQWLKEIKAPSGRLFRWRLRLSRYEYEVRSINGVQQYETGVVTQDSPRSADNVPERPSTGSQPGEEFSPKTENMKNTKENSSENQIDANPPAGDMHVNLAAARDDVTAPTTAASTSATTASPASLNWADSEMAEVDANEGYTVVKSQKRRLSSTPEHAAKQASRPAERRGPQQQKRTTGPRSMPPQEIKATRANIAAARARQATTNHENCIFVELCPDIPDYSYIRAMSKLFGGPRDITQFHRMNGHYIVGLVNKDFANRLVADGLEIEGTSLKVFPFRKRAERIVVANLPSFVEDNTIVDALSQYGKVTSIAPILVKMGEFTFTDGRREAFILLREGVRLETLPTRLTIHSKGDTLSAFLSFGIKCSKCGKQGHRRANCPSLARQNSSPRQAASPTDARPPPHLLLLLSSQGGRHLRPEHRRPLSNRRKPSALADSGTGRRPQRAGQHHHSLGSRLQPHHPQDPPEDLGEDAYRRATMSFRIANINARGLATGEICHLLRQHHVDIAFVQETNAFHLGSGQDLCLSYSAVVLAHPVAISGSGLACVFGPGVAVLQQRILWPGHIALATIDVRGEEMTAIAVHLAHEPRERNRQLELLAATAAQEDEGACWIIGDFNIRDRGPSSLSSSDALAALLDLAALVDVATQFDAAHLPTRVAMHGDQVESNRLDWILVPAGVLDRVSIYATSHYHLSDHRLVLLQVGPPTTAVSSPTQPRLAAMLRSGLVLEHLAGYIRELEEDTAHDDDDGILWDRWTTIKAGLLADARSLHDPRHAASYIYRARRYIAAQLEASSIRADYPSRPDLARAICLRRPVSVIRDEQDNIIEGPELRRRAFATFQPRFARPTSDPAAGAAFIASSAPTTTRELSEEDPLHRPDISPSEIANAIEHLPRGKAPGWDGLPCELLVAFNEDFFAEALARVFASSRPRDALPPSTRRSSICLVPKTRGGRGLDGYRPVALPSADYRVLAAILHRRLKPHLRTLVPECQTYAVPGRAPSWNIAMVTDAIEEATALGSPLAVMGHHLHGYLPSPPTIAKLQARLARFVWGQDHTAWLPADVMARPVAIGGLDLATQLQLACLKGVQVALRGGRNAFSWLVGGNSGEAWIHPSPDGTRLQPRRLRLLKLWEEASNILGLNHRAVPTAQLLDLPIIGGCRFLRPPDLLAPARWSGARVRDLIEEEHIIARPTRSALADAAALGAFCRRLTSENAVGFGAESTPSSSSLAAAVVLRGTATPFLNGLTTRSARRALDRPRLAATPISRFLARWTPTINPPSRTDWASLRRCAYSGHEADAALKLALHALPHPAHPASVGPSCPACGSIDRSLGHRYWCCRSIRPLIREAFNIIGRPPDLQAWIFGGSDLEDDAFSILASAKLRIYRYFVQVGLGEAVEDPLIAWSRTLQRRVPANIPVNTLVGSVIQHHLHGYLLSPPTIAKLQARLARFVWGQDHTAWLPADVMARPVAIGGLDLATQLQLACLKGVQVALRGGRNAFSWLVGGNSGEAWIHPSPDGTRLQPRRLRLLKLWEEASNILGLNHRAVPTAQLLDLPIIGGCRFLRPPDLLAPARWSGARVRDLIEEEHIIARPTRSALADAAALGAFCRRLTSENAVGFGAESTPSSSSLAAAVVLRGTATPFLNGLTTRSARRALDRPRLAATPISRFLARWTPTINPPSRTDWASLRRCAYSGHEADAALKLALHALPHPAHPASVGPSCPACGSIDRSLGHRYWCCRSIRPIIREAFNIIGRPPDLQAWIFGGSDLEDDALSILASAKLRIYRYFVQVGLGEAVEDPLIAWSRTLQRR
ncbi:hypothetical protein LAZ67_10003334, partial [Cordylochernes scorpioides]